MGDWKGGGRRRREPTSIPRPSTSAKAPGWQGGPGKRGGPSRDWGLWLKRLLSIGAVLVIGIAIGVIVLRQRELTPLIVLSAQTDSSNASFVIPPRAGATREYGIWEQDFKSLKVRRAKMKETDPEKGLLKQIDDLDLKVLKPGGPKKNVVMVSISAQGAVNQRGEPCLLDKNSEPFNDESSSWTPLRLVFEKLDKRIPSLAKPHVVVFLDSGTAETDWTLGWLRDEFQERVKKEVENDPEFLPKRWQLIHVRGALDLASFAQTGRRAHLAQVLSSGLSGGAENTKNKRNDQIVSLREMIDFIEQQTGIPPDVWSRDKTQSDIQLCWVEKKIGDRASTQLSLEPVPSRLNELWTTHNELESDKVKPWRYKPWDWARFEWLVLRAERAWLAGDSVLLNEVVKAAKLQSDKLRLPLTPFQDAVPPVYDESPDWKKFLTQVESSVTPKAGSSLDLRSIPKDSSKNSPVGTLAVLLNRFVCEDYAEVTKSNSHQITLANLIGLRQIAESNVWPSDFRTEAIIRHRAEQVDEKRRQLEDLAFIGGDENWKKIDTEISAVRKNYEDLKNASYLFSQRLERRDFLLAKLPWLFRWAEVARAPAAAQQDLMVIWDDVANAIRNFDQSVIDPATLDWGQFELAIKKFEEIIDGDSPARNAEKLNNSDKRTSREWAGDAIPFFSTPLVSGITRTKLLENLRQKINAGLQQIVNTGVDPNLKQKEENEKVLPDPDPFAMWSSHPLRVMLPTDLTTAEKNDPLKLGHFNFNAGETPVEGKSAWAEIGGNIRNSFKRLPESTVWSTLLDNKPDQRLEITNHYRSLVSCEAHGRALAVASCAGTELGEETPQPVIARLELLERATYYDWRVARAMLDFYGPTDFSSQTLNPFYQRHADFWLDVLGRSDGGRNSFSPIFLTDRRRSLDAWKNLAKPLLNVVVDPDKLDFKESDDPKPVGVTVSINRAGDFVPTGRVALEIPGSTQTGQAADRIRKDSLQLSGGSTSWKQEISVPRGTTSMPVTAFFRGHAALDTKIVRHVEKVEPPFESEIVLEPTPTEATVYVKGTVTQKLWVMIIFDCSLSMNSKVKGKEVPGKTEITTRFEIAKNSIKELLRKLLEAQNSQIELHVGLLAYGYRVGIVDYGTKDKPDYAIGFVIPGGVSKNPPIQADEDTFEGDREENLKTLDPSLDVGILVPFDKQQWDQKAYGSMKDKIDRRVPIGITPLYLSISHAADYMKSLPKDDPKVILVLTDGVDNQETIEASAANRKSWKLFDPEKKNPKLVKTRAGDAMKQLNKLENLKVNIVGFDTPVETGATITKDSLAQGSEGLRELERFCDDPKKREFMLTHNGEELAAKLTVQLPKVSIRVRPADGVGESDKKLGELGNSITLPDPAGKKFKIEVIRGSDSNAEPEILATTETISIHGGDQLELLFLSKAAQLKFQRGWDSISNTIDPNVPKADNSYFASYNLRKTADKKELRSHAGPGQWQAAVLAPETIGESPETIGESRLFRVAFRPLSDSVSPARPTLMRAVVTPVLSTGDTGNCPYIFESEDARFQPNQSVPVMEFVATNWRQDWVQANLEVWLCAPGDELNASNVATVTEDLAEQIENPTKTVKLPPYGNLKINIGKQKAISDNIEVTIQQAWEPGVQMPLIKDLPILQVSPRPLKNVRKIQVKNQEIEYTFTFSRTDFNRNKYRLRILNPAALPQSLDEGTLIKRLLWKEIDFPK